MFWKFLWLLPDHYIHGGTGDSMLGHANVHFFTSKDDTAMQRGHFQADLALPITGIVMYWALGSQVSIVIIKTRISQYLDLNFDDTVKYYEPSYFL